MLSVASMMSLNELDNFEFDDDNRSSSSSIKKANRLSGSFLNESGKCLSNGVIVSKSSYQI